MAHEEEVALHVAPRPQGEGVKSVYQTFGTAEFHAVEAAFFEDEEMALADSSQVTKPFARDISSRCIHTCLSGRPF